uniref:Uncharacterized protein n=1 Tax=Steinernema glaseri TaxID=37863 RepID=A0A1I7Y168_9BILA
MDQDQLGPSNIKTDVSSSSSFSLSARSPLVSPTTTPTAAVTVKMAMEAHTTTPTEVVITAPIAWIERRERATKPSVTARTSHTLRRCTTVSVLAISAEVSQLIEEETKLTETKEIL